ncbi:MAG: TetR/AcrR family transcriptional regulator [Anaerovoracaceae bacterium]
MSVEGNGKYERTHKALVQCAIQMFYEEGFDAVSIQKICRRAGVSRANFYRHFKNKEHLLSEYYENLYFFSEEMKKWVENAPDPWVAIIRMQILYIQNMCNSDHADLISHYLSYRLTEAKNETVFDFPNKMEERLTRLLREAQAAAIIGNPSDARYLCSSIFMMHAGNIFNWCARGGKFDCFTDFFWNLEAVLCVSEAYRGMWKMEIRYIQ